MRQNVACDKTGQGYVQWAAKSHETIPVYFYTPVAPERDGAAKLELIASVKYVPRSVSSHATFCRTLIDINF